MPKGPKQAKTPKKLAQITPDLTPQAPQPVKMVVPKHGKGLIRVGGTNKGGTGAPPSVIREQLRGSIAERASMLERIMDGVPMQRASFSVATLAKYVTCANCGEAKIRPIDLTAGSAEIETKISASPKDRIAAFDTAARYGLGVLKEVSVENVRERVAQTLDTIRRHCTEEQAHQIIDALRPVWK